VFGVWRSVRPHAVGRHERHVAGWRTRCLAQRRAATALWSISTGLCQRRLIDPTLHRGAAKTLWQLSLEAAHKANPEALHTLPDSILQSIAWGEAVALMWGLRRQTQNLPVGLDPYAIINNACPGFGTAIAGLVHKVKLPPLDDLQWRQLSSTEAPYKPTFKNWLCLPWLPDQCAASSLGSLIDVDGIH